MPTRVALHRAPPERSLLWRQYVGAAARHLRATLLIDKEERHERSRGQNEP
jgi:hypothetical protein